MVQGKERNTTDVSTEEAGSSILYWRQAVSAQKQAIASPPWPFSARSRLIKASEDRNVFESSDWA
jgi:hypothetical protein